MSYCKGQRVVIINSTLQGVFIEGYATITSVINAANNRYKVRFDNEKASRPRFVNPDAQNDPQAFCDKLNTKRS